VKSYRELRNIAGILDPRAMCYKCVRPASHCVCEYIQSFKAHCNFLILQHPHERKKYYSTSKIVLNAISNSKVLYGVTFDESEVSASLDGKIPYLLYPSQDAIDCSNLNLNDDSTVIIIDGTWVEARKIVYRNKFLQSLPKISFKQPILSQYKIRKQPKDFCLSTLECIGHLLKMSIGTANNDDLIKNYDQLFNAFNMMVEKQLNHFPRMRDSLSLDKTNLR
jgi:DTW domain-containing protein YfiP